jgi:2-polyprenyl-6-methoxyphenol hydroxylase-like FAD-dependent oxidoreductase
MIGQGGGHAVVIGGSIAGLSAALVLAKHAERVTIVERDRYPEQPEPRKGVPQGKHIHILLEGGLAAFRRLLPGIDEDLLAAGAVQVAMPTDFLEHSGGRWLGRWPAEATAVCLTRPLLEHEIRTRVLAHPRITAVQGTDVVGLAGSATRVTGVLLRERGADRGKDRDRDVPPAELAADLVVDASGRSSRTPEWLEGLGIGHPAQERVESGVGYVTRVYRDGSNGELTDAAVVLFQGEGVLARVDHQGTTFITFATPPGKELPTDPDAFEALADRLPHPVMRQWIDLAEPASPVFGYLRTENVRHDYAAVVPDGLLVTGDALCALNPLFGQGMTAAALAAEALDKSITAGHPPRAAQAALLAASAQAWAIAAGADKARPGATGNAVRRSLGDKLTSWYIARVQERGAVNEDTQTTIRKVFGLVVPFTELFRPAIVRSVLFQRSTPTDAEAPLRLVPAPASAAPAPE